MQMIILNNYSGPFECLVNCLILIAKQYIYFCHRLKERPCVNNIEFRIVHYQTLEQIIATKKNLLFKHNAKWNENETFDL